MDINQHSHKSNQHRVYKISALIIILAIMANACKFSPLATMGKPTLSTEEAELLQEITPSPTIMDSGLTIVDDGSPIAPQVIEFQPQGGSELSLDGKIQFTFDQEMDQETTESSIEIIDQDGEKVVGHTTWVNTRTIQFQPTDQLKPGTIYYANLGSSAKSVKGLQIKEPFSFQFSSVGDLEISQVFPANEAQDIESNAIITVIFNRPIAPLVILEEKGGLIDPLSFTPQIEGKGEWINTSVYAFEPDPPLHSGETYTISIPAGLEDATGESSLVEDYTWQFTTAYPAIDTFEISSGRVNPPDNHESVLLDEFFELRFLQAMDPNSTENALSIKTDTGEELNLRTLWSEDSKQLIITPTQRLDLDTTYSFNLSTDAQAASGGNLVDGVQWNFTTIPSPKVVYTRPGHQQYQDSFSRDFTIKFASPMRIDTVKERIVISPKPEQEINWWYNEWDWSLSGFFLEPSTTYKIRFLPGMEDIYGNKNQDEQFVEFTTPARPPYASLLMPYQPAIMRADNPEDSQIFYSSYRNINSINYQLYRLSQETFLSFLTGDKNSYEYEPPETNLVWEVDEQSRADLNDYIVTSYQLTNEEGESLEPGFYFLGMNSPQISSDRPYNDVRLIIVENANLTFKTSNKDSLVWVTDLESGEPIKNVRLSVFSQESLGIPWLVTSDEKGMAYLDFQKLGYGQNLPTDKTANTNHGAFFMEPQKPLSGSGRHEYYALADDGSVFGFASSDWGSGIALGDYGIWVDYYSTPKESVAYVYTERPIYRPGQPVYFKGIVRVDNDLDYEMPFVEEVKIVIENYKEVIYEDTINLSQYGSFDGKYILDTETTLGYYTLYVYLPNSDEKIGSISFNVAEYRKPEFQVQVDAKPDNLLKGEEFIAEVQADYYSGGGVADATVEWSLESNPFTFTPPDEFSNYNFSDYEADLYHYEEDNEYNSKIIAEGQGTTDANGKFKENLLIDLSEYKSSRQLVFEASITDISKNSVSGRTEIVAHQSSVYPGIRPQNYIGEQDEEQTFEIVTLDWNGEPISNQKVNVEIVERRWYSVQEQDATGNVTWTSSVEEIPVIEFEDLQTNTRGETEVSFTPEQGGIYRARVTAPDDKNNLGKASAFLWVAGTNYIPWRQTNDRGFDLITDKKNYSPGDVAEVLIASPFQGQAQALVTVERGRIRYQDVIEITSNSTIVEVPINEDMSPNAYISVVVIKGVDETNPRPSFKMGMAEIGVDRLQRIINLEIEADPVEASPGEQVIFTVKTSNFEGEPISSEVSMSLSDLATLSLLPPNSQPIDDFFFSERDLGVRTSVPIALSIDDYNAEIQESEVDGGGMGGGGGKGSGELGVIDVREDFPDTAFWDAFIETNQEGEATVSITLPDNLTTWRMDARAITKNTLVGQTTFDIISSKPLLIRPQTPRFFVVNDHVRIGAAVQNNTKQDLETKVSLESSGITLLDDRTQNVTVPAGGQKFISWNIAVNLDAERVDLIFRVEGESYQDASRPPLGILSDHGIPVYRYEVPETVGTSGMMTEEGTIIEAIRLPETMNVTSGDLSLSVSPSLAAGMTDGLDYLEHYPYECVEQTISRFLPNVLSTKALKSAGINNPDLEDALIVQVDTALQRLYKWQNADGGWGWWSGQESNSFNSAYAVLGLVEAQLADYQVNTAVIERGIAYLKTQIKPIDGLANPSDSNRQAFLLYVLAHSDEPNISATVQLYDQRQRMAIYGRAFLANTLYLIDSEDTRIDSLLSDFSNKAITSATGSHWVEESQDRWNWNTDTRTTAIVLSALSLIDAENPLNANAVRWLMSNRSRGHWYGTQETAWSLMALTNWMVASGELEADYQYAVALNGNRLGGGIADSETLRQSLDLKVDISELLRDEINRLAFARDSGEGNLYYTAFMNLDLPVEEVQAIDQGIVIARDYYLLDDIETPVQNVQQGELVLVRLTIVAPNTLHYVVIDDPLPAGLEAVDQSLLTSPQNVEIPRNYTMEDVFWRGWGWWYFTHTQMYDERVVLSSNRLPAGTYVYTYLARASSVGIFRTIPTTVQEFYFPEVYGRGEGALFTVTP